MLHVWNIYQHLPKNHPNVGKYTIYGAYGYVFPLFFPVKTAGFPLVFLGFPMDGAGAPRQMDHQAAGRHHLPRPAAQGLGKPLVNEH